MNLHKLKPNSNLDDKYDTLKFDKFQLRFLKQLLGVNKFSTNVAVRGELGSFPVTIFILIQSIKFWIHLLELPIDSLARRSLYDAMSSNSNWVISIKNILSYFGFAHVWENQGTFSNDKLVNALKQKMQHHYIKWWSAKIKSFSKLDFYRKFKNSFALDEYLLCRDVRRPTRSSFSRFRISAHSLLVEVGRYSKLKRDDRCCSFCKNAVLYCNLFNPLRLKYFSVIANISSKPVVDEEYILNITKSYDVNSLSC